MLRTLPVVFAILILPVFIPTAAAAEPPVECVAFDQSGLPTVRVRACPDASVVCAHTWPVLWFVFVRLCTEGFAVDEDGAGVDVACVQGYAFVLGGLCANAAASGGSATANACLSSGADFYFGYSMQIECAQRLSAGENGASAGAFCSWTWLSAIPPAGSVRVIERSGGCVGPVGVAGGGVAPTCVWASPYRPLPSVAACPFAIVDPLP